MTMRKIAQILFVLGVFCLPSYLIRGVLFGIPTNLLDILEGMSIVACFLVLAQEKKQFFWVFRAYRGTLLAFSCIFLGSFLSAMFSGGISGHEWGILKSWIVLPFLFVFLGGMCGFLRSGLFAYGASACVVALVALAVPLETGITYDGRLRGWYESPNQLAMYMAPAIVFLYFWVRLLGKEKRKSGTLFVVGSLFFLGFALWETKSLGGIFSVFASIFLGELFLFFRNPASSHRNVFSRPIPLLWRGAESSRRGGFLPKGAESSRRGGFLPEGVESVCHLSARMKREGLQQHLSQKKEHVWRVLLGGGVILLCVALCFSLVSEKIGERSSFASRIMIWKSSWYMIQESPIFGIGPGNFQEKYLEYQRFFPPYLEWAVPHPHNTLLAFWLYSGLLGLIGFSGLCFQTFRQFRQQQKTADTLGIGVFCAFFSLLIFGLVDTTIWGNAISVVFWMIVFGGTFSKNEGGVRKYRELW